MVDQLIQEHLIHFVYFVVPVVLSLLFFCIQFKASSNKYFDTLLICRLFLRIFRQKKKHQTTCILSNFPCAQENDIFLGWEKGTGKKWGKSKKKGGPDLSLEEMKKQAAVQCLRSASDEVRPLLQGIYQMCFVFLQPLSHHCCEFVLWD